MSKFIPVTPRQLDVPLVHRLSELYRTIYSSANQIPKRDRFGLYLKIENLCLEALNLAITAAFESKQQKLPTLNFLRINIEVMKRLIRTAHELNMMSQKTNIAIQQELQEISKMVNGWLKFLK